MDLGFGVQSLCLRFFEFNAGLLYRVSIRVAENQKLKNLESEMETGSGLEVGHIL